MRETTMTSLFRCYFIFCDLEYVMIRESECTLNFDLIEVETLIDLALQFIKRQSSTLNLYLLLCKYVYYSSLIRIWDMSFLTNRLNSSSW